MQNLPPQALPVQPVAPATTAAASNKSSTHEPDGEKFNAILAKEQAGKAPPSDKALPADKAAATQERDKEDVPGTNESPTGITQPSDAIISLLMTVNPLAVNLNTQTAIDSKMLLDGQTSPGKTTPDNLPAARLTAMGDMLQATFSSSNGATDTGNRHPANPAAHGNFMPGFSDIAGKIQASVSDADNLLSPTDGIPLSGLFPSPETSTTLAALTTLQSGNLTPATHSVRLDTPVAAPTWGDELSQKITWLATQKQQVAELHLNPAHLGPIEITLTINNEDRQASAQFVSSHFAVREAIEQALPKLREMMAENGISLGNINVTADSPRQQAEQSHQQSAQQHTSHAVQQESDSLLPHGVTHLLSHNKHEGMVDIFA